jgi:copper transport protein
VIETLGLVVRSVMYAGILSIVGTAAFRLLVLKRSGVGAALVGRASRRAARIGAIASGLVLISSIARLVLQTAEMRFPSDSWLVVGRQMLLDTSWGTVWMVQTACAVLLAMSFTLARKDALPRWSTIAVLSAVLAGASAFASHAMSAQRLTEYTKQADVLHILAASTWLGTLFVMTLSVLGNDANEPGSELPATELRSRYIVLLLRAFSPVALVSGAILVTSGALSALAHVTSMSELVGTSYGQALLRKLVFVVLVFVFGWRNWKFVTPRLATDGPRSMTRGMAVELCLAAVVLVLTAVLVVTPPPAEVVGA